MHSERKLGKRCAGFSDHCVSGTTCDPDTNICTAVKNESSKCCVYNTRGAVHPIPPSLSASVSPTFALSSLYLFTCPYRFWHFVRVGIRPTQFQDFAVLYWLRIINNTMFYTGLEIINFCYTDLQVINMCYTGFQIFSICNGGLEIINICYTDLQVINMCYTGFQIITICYDGLQIINICYTDLQIINMCYTGFQIISICYDGLQIIKMMYYTGSHIINMCYTGLLIINMCYTGLQIVNLCYTGLQIFSMCYTGLQIFSMCYTGLQIVSKLCVIPADYLWLPDLVNVVPV